ncbi:TetR/AcrR family transcriptional regulator [Glycocaulis sp.]|uniref:TetR/AcrR family transcriptional regulator n=1 Tax=Glycocaulis sp. TaxID=1969725 RepID=UPI003F6E68FE
MATARSASAGKPASTTAKKASKPSVKEQQRAEKMEQILDAAERLFALRGLYNVTLKDIATDIGVHHTLLNYYFSDKDKLFGAVLSRRASETIGRRMQAMDAHDAETDGKPTVEGALHAFLDTDLDLYSQGGESWKYYGMIGGQLSNTVFGGELMDQNFDPVVLRLIALLRKAIPGSTDEDLFWGYHFVTGALMLTLSRTGRIDRLSGGVCSSDDFGSIRDRMARFMAAGFREICAQRAEERAPSSGKEG